TMKFLARPSLHVLFTVLSVCAVSRAQAQGVAILRAGSGGQTQLAPGTRIGLPVVLDMSAGAGLDVASFTTAMTWDAARLQYDSLVVGGFGAVTPDFSS